MARVRIKNVKNSRNHTILPIGWNTVETYNADKIDDTHWKVRMPGNGYIIWPVEDVENLDDAVQPVPVELAMQLHDLDPHPVKTSDGGSSPYYEILPGEKDAQDIIERKSMNFARGNVFKAAWRMGEKDVASELYDWRKIKWFAEREIARLEKANGT